MLARAPPMPPSQLLSILAVVLLVALLLAIPLAIVRYQRGIERERIGEMLLWAKPHEMTTTDASAVPAELQSLHSGVVSFVWRGGVLSLLTVTMRQGTTHTLWWIPPEPLEAGPAYAVASGLGSGLGHTTPRVPTGDAAFDAAFDARAADADAVPRVLSPALRAAMLARRGDLDTVSWDGTRWSVTQKGTGEPASLWDGALRLFEIARPPD